MGILRRCNFGGFVSNVAVRTCERQCFQVFGLVMDESEEHISTYNVNISTGDVIFTSATSSGISSANSATASALFQGNEMPPPPNPEMPSSSKTSLGKLKPPGKVKVKDVLEKDSNEYQRRRRRNNVAVRKSREKTRERSASTLQKVEQLKVENEELESKISILTKELSVLKDLFMDHARGFCGTGNSVHLSPEQLEQLLGCKAIRDNSVTATTSFETANAVHEESTQSVSTIQPLINVAEIELMGMRENMDVHSVSDPPITSSISGGVHKIDDISWTSADTLVTLTLETEES